MIRGRGISLSFFAYFRNAPLFRILILHIYQPYLTLVLPVSWQVSLFYNIYNHAFVLH